MKCTFKPYGENAILITWEARIDENIVNDILQFEEKIKQSNIKAIVEVIQSINSLLIIYNENNISFFELKHLLETLKNTKTPVTQQDNRKKWQIPVCYHENFGIDLRFIAEKKRLEIPEIIAFHTSAIYDVYAIGFLPGFLYLGGLDERLHIPRKETPRLRIQKGAVGIGGMQTGIYPKSSPGGWQILGNSPVNFFDVTQSNPCFAKAGDQIQFYEINMQEYDEILVAIKTENYNVKYTKL